jgi:hypothetical protein
MKKNRREFFEVFRRVPEEKEPTTWWRKNAEASSADEPAAAVPIGVKPLSRREPATPSNKVVLTLSRELLVVLGVALVMALVGAFVWGHYRGSANPASVAIGSSQPSDAVKAAPLVISTPSLPALPYYTLRLTMQIIDHHNAGLIAADLCAMGYDAFPLQLNASSWWSVNIGRFPDYRAKDADALKKKINSVTYKNQRLLCSWVKILK